MGNGRGGMDERLATSECGLEGGSVGHVEFDELEVGRSGIKRTERMQLGVVGESTHGSAHSMVLRKEVADYKSGNVTSCTGDTNEGFLVELCHGDGFGWIENGELEERVCKMLVPF